MKVTKELLTRLKAYKTWLDVIKKYPDGAQLVELLADPDLEFDDLYFARHYFNFDEEELKTYKDRCKIINCGDHILQSHDISDSNWIYNSSFVKNSHYINHSENIANGFDIINTIDCIDSKNIINSKRVNYSENVADSGDIVNSDNIINSNHISWSHVINSCYELEDCSFVYKGHKLKDCYFCGFVEESNHCLFCNNVSNVEYQIFNQPVTIEEFERVKEILNFQLDAENVSLINIDDERHLEARFSYDLRFDRMFEKLSEDFYGWVGSLPQYDEQIFLLLFFTTLK